MCFLSLDSIGFNSQRHLNLLLFVLNISTKGRWMTWHRSTRTVIRRTCEAWTRWIPVPVGPSAWIYRHVQPAEQQLQVSESQIKIMSDHCVVFIFFPAPVHWINSSSMGIFSYFSFYICR